MSYTAEQVLLPMQRLQREHDKLAHQDILGFDLYKRLKHMVLHFYKYSGKVCAAAESDSPAELRKVLLDCLIICMATANALNVSLGKDIRLDVAPSNLDELAKSLANISNINSKSLFDSVLRDLSIFGGAMAKAMESSDHMEEGNPRAEMSELVILLASSILAHLGKMGGSLEDDIKSRFFTVEKKSIFSY